MKIAVEGCCHGELDKIYETLAFLEKSNDIKVDLLLICGDFQSVRNKSDLQTMAVPQKYQKMNTFWKYYSGEKKAPVLTVFIGGNHEASNYLQELPYGGWVAPNIYYMGYAGVIQCGGIRIGGLSGIYKGRDYNRGHYEHPPYSEETKRTCYHIRNLEVFRLKQIKQPIDIFVSHDWPRGIYNYGNVERLLRKKAFFREEVENGSLGNPSAEELLNHLKPDYWFSAHLHVKFAAVVNHELETGQSKQTKFLALDKCLPRRKFLQVIDVPTDSEKPIELELDPEWLCVLKATNHLLNLSKSNCYMPGIGCSERYDFTTTELEIKTLSEDFGGLFKIPDNFERGADVYNPKGAHHGPPPQILINPQTTLICEMLSLTDPFAVFSGKQHHNVTGVVQSPCRDTSGPDDSALMDDSAVVDDSDFIDDTLDSTTINTTLEITANPDEISLDDLDDDDDDDDDPASEDAGSSSPLTNESRFSLPAPIFSDEKALFKERILSNPDEISLDIGDDLSTSKDQSVLKDESTDKLNVSAESDSSVSSGKRSISMEMDNQSSATGDEGSPTKVQKFKRRNLSLYTNTDES